MLVLYAKAFQNLTLARAANRRERAGEQKGYKRLLTVIAWCPTEPVFGWVVRVVWQAKSFE